MSPRLPTPARSGKALRLALAACLALAGFGCVPSFRGREPLAFKDIPYTATDGTAWPVKTLRLKSVEEAYKIATPLEIAVVEKNPEGKVPLVFIHGLGSHLKFWRHQIDHFAKLGHRVIALDLPGYGKSSKPASFPYTMESFADVVRAVVKEMGIEHPILIGHSMGGHTALSYAIRWPDEPRALVLTAPAGFEEFSRRDKDWFRRAVTLRFIKSADEYRVWGAIRHNNFHHWSDQHLWLVEERVRLAKAPDFDSYAYANLKSIHGLLETDFIRQNLGRIKAPTIIVYGDKDALIPNPFLHGGFPSDVMRFGHEHIAGSTLTELSGCGHMVQMDCTDRYNETVRGFLGIVEKLPAQPPAGSGEEVGRRQGRSPDKAAAEKAAADKARCGQGCCRESRVRQGGCTGGRGAARRTREFGRRPSPPPWPSAWPQTRLLPTRPRKKKAAGRRPPRTRPLRTKLPRRRRSRPVLGRRREAGNERRGSPKGDPGGESRRRGSGSASSRPGSAG
ncbi:MAG: alpha/beta hydrolase [Polyangiaceae bacterium]